jgi:hypothetical protein
VETTSTHTQNGTYGMTHTYVGQAMRATMDEVRNAQDGLVNSIGRLKRLLGDSRVPASDRAQYQAELSEASRLLDYSEQFVPRT